MTTAATAWRRLLVLLIGELVALPYGAIGVWALSLWVADSAPVAARLSSRATGVAEFSLPVLRFPPGRGRPGRRRSRGWNDEYLTSHHRPRGGNQHRRSQVAFVGALLWSAGLVAAGLLWLVGFIEAPFGTFTPENFSALIDALPPTASSLLIIVVGAVGAGIAWLSLLRKESPPLAVLAPIGRFRACRRAASVDARSRGCRLRCGERLPRWVPELGGRRVPVALAAIPVTIGGLAIFAGGVMFVRVFATGAFPLDENWTTVGPELLWSLWGIALAVALAEYVRRRVHIDQPA